MARPSPCHPRGIPVWLRQGQPSGPSLADRGGGYGTHWPETDEDLSTEGLPRGTRVPSGSNSCGQGRGCPEQAWGQREMACEFDEGGTCAILSL